jgi:uncharacterized membrane protein YraQ (UPF0718 family)
MQNTNKINQVIGPAMVVMIAVAGLYYVKWSPYYARAFTAAANHAIGKSILMGTEAQAPAPSWDAALGYALAYGKAIWQAMVLGLLLGSAVQALLPTGLIARLLGRRGFAPVFAAGLMSLPGMMCTCCAAPVVVGLRRERATPGAAIAFWLGNTVLNPATLIFIGFVLGWNWAALRLALGVVMVFGLGFLVNSISPPDTTIGAVVPEPEVGGNPFLRWLGILARMSVRLIPEYIVIVLALGAARAWLFPVIGPDIGNSLIWIVAFAVAGMVFVIPTAGEVPIIQGMLSLGMGVGPAGALLMTLPPISLPSVAMLVRSFHPRALALVAGGVLLFGIFGGMLAVALGF